MREVAVVVIVASLFASTAAAVSVRDQRRWNEKLGPALAHVAKQGGESPVSALIHLRPGTADRFVSRLEELGLNSARVVTPDVIVAQLPPTMLRSVAADRRVVSLSEQANVGVK